MSQRPHALLLLLLAPVAASSQEEGVDAERLRAARALAPDRVMMLSGHYGHGDDGSLREPMQLRFDAAGRFAVDYSGEMLRDVSFDGERAWSVDAAGRPYPLSGVDLDANLAISGIVCGNWLTASPSKFEWELESLGEAPVGPGVPGRPRVRARLLGRHAEIVLELDAEGLPRRMELDWFGRDRTLSFLDWRANELGRWPARIELFEGAVHAATFEYATLEVADDATFGPPVDAGHDVRFDPDAPRELDVRRVASGHTFVRVEVDGEEVGWMLFDTGASRGLLDARVADRLGLEVLLDGLRSGGAGGTARFTVRRARTQRVGPLTWHDPVVGVADLSALERSFGVQPFVGLLGGDMLAHAVWEYDVTAKRIVAHPPGTDGAPEGTTWIPVETNEGQLIAPARFEGHEGRFIVDTGAGSPLYLNAPTVERFGLLEGRDTSPLSVRGTGGVVSALRAHLTEVEFGGRSFENLRSTFTTCDVEGSWCNPYVDGIAGIDLLRGGPVWFDYPERRIGVTPR